MKSLICFGIASIFVTTLNFQAAAQTEPLHDTQVRSFYVQKLMEIQMKLVQDQAIAQKFPSQKHNAVVAQDKARLSTWTAYCSRLQFSHKRQVQPQSPPVISLI